MFFAKNYHCSYFFCKGHALALAENGPHAHTGGLHAHIGGAHQHGETTGNGGAAYTVGSGSNFSLNNNQLGNANRIYTDSGGVVATTSDGAVATTSSGSGTAHNTMQPSLVVNYLIKF